MKKYVLILTTLLSFSLGANASPMEKAQQLMDVIKIEDQINAQFEGSFPMVEELKESIALTDQEIAELSNIIKEWIRNDIDVDKIVTATTNFYATNFTESELNELIAFYQTPTGKKLISKMPILTNEVAGISVLEAKNKQTKLLERLQSFLGSKM